MTFAQQIMICIKIHRLHSVILKIDLLNESWLQLFQLAGSHGYKPSFDGTCELPYSSCGSCY